MREFMGRTKLVKDAPVTPTSRWLLSCPVGFATPSFVDCKHRFNYCIGASIRYHDMMETGRTLI